MMKIIDILNKIANHEKVRFKILDNDEIRDEIFEVENGQLRNSTCGKWLETKVSSDTWESISSYFLNEEVEIIEEEKKIPEKLEKYYDENLEEYVVETYIKGVNYKEIFNSKYDEMIISKLNEVLDYLKSKGE